MTEYDVIVDGSNLLLYGSNKRNFKVNLKQLKSNLTYFRKRGQRALICVDTSTISKIEKGKINTTGSFEEFNEILQTNDVFEIYSDHQMAEFALKFACPVVTNDKFRDWRSGKASHKNSTVSKEQWEELHKQSIPHRQDKSGKFTTVPPIQTKIPALIDEDPTESMANENLLLKEQLESLRRKNELHRAEIATYRKILNIG
ncbi:hypothetical protein CMO85_05700 [Candidatus Woesearchaeota archaeon]|nr:hypothetical protein [Candidatus Woesearchaeota archaeon]